MSKVARLPLSAEALSRIHALANDVTIEQLHRAEIAARLIAEPPAQSTLIAMLFGGKELTPLERERILQLLEPPRRSRDRFPEAPR